MKNVFMKTVSLGAMVVIAACSQKVSESPSDSSASGLGQSNAEKAIVSFNLTDAPNKDLKSVVVDIDHMEVVVAGAGKAGRLILAKGLGPVDLLQLQNGVTLPLQDVEAPAGIRIQQIRLVLKPSGHYAVKGDDSICELKTPSAQKTGVKIILTNKVQFEAGHHYNIVVDFDALKSVVVQGNGGCLLKPVLKLKSAYKTPIVQPEPPVDNGGGDGSSGGGDAGSGGEDNGSGSGSGEEPSEPVVEEPVVEQPEEPGVGEETGSGDASGGESSEGEELVTEPEQNDPADDGWDYTPIVDGEDYPVVTQDELGQLL
ncbi:hypothetical protein Bb109J_c2710 [Bdellovibrio bacteriovorus]|uniref:DUF4382 domain-containing protein n=1 Tax=Bdellovibrio bacteriovorus TaxID=959 RepID=UPI00045BEC9B|nr:DUF4382 domain-containing protein [Bdellovibrio bacteriovorus]AHZ85396.1 hypothetical protein EP01_10660 [Bdellovibrio bacteriovorus]BEV69290.1 hypothetical protein Bb109J_c2710 [Bdellovibrio bacteriovorus]